MTAHNNHRRPSAATAWGPSPTEGIIVPGATVVGQPAPWVARNPGVAVGRIVGPITSSIGIPPWPNPSRNPYIPCAFYRIPVSVRIQIIPVFILRIRGIIAHWSLQRSFLGYGLVPILIPVIPGIAIDALCNHVGSPAIVSPGTNALVLRNGYSGDAISLHLDRTANDGNVPSC